MKLLPGHGNRLVANNPMDNLKKPFQYCLGLVALMLGLALQAAESDHQKSLESMAYGQALFHNLQQDELSAITQLLRLRQKPGTQSQIEETELLLANSYSSYGLNDDAESLYFQLLGNNTSPGLKNRVWFSLAKNNYDQGQFDTARELLASIDSELPVQVESEKQYLLTNLYLRNMHQQKAAEAIQQIPAGSIFRAYARYNLGIWLIENNQFDQGKEILDLLGQISSPSAELAALRDQANLALGLSQLRHFRPEQALTSFSRIRLQSALSHQALLGVGWAWSRLGNFDRALGPWLELTDKNTIDAAKMEALLAVPAAFEQAQRNELAIQYYKSAVKEFDLQLDSLDLLTNSIRQNNLIEALIQNEVIRTTNGFARNSTSSNQTPYLLILMASKGFQKEVDRYQDLFDIHLKLDYWGSNLKSLALTLNQNRFNFAQNPLPGGQPDNFRRAREQYANLLKNIEARHDSLGLATTNEKNQLQYLEKISKEKNTNAQGDKNRLLSKQLNRQINSEYPLRLKQAKNQLLGLDKALVEYDRRIKSMRLVSGKSQQRDVEFELRIEGQNLRVNTLRQRVAKLMKQQESRISQLAISIIRQQQENITELQVSARYSLAHLYDSQASD